MFEAGISLLALAAAAIFAMGAYSRGHRNGYSDGKAAGILETNASQPYCATEDFIAAAERFCQKVETQKAVSRATYAELKAALVKAGARAVRREMVDPDPRWNQ